MVNIQVLEKKTLSRKVLKAWIFSKFFLPGSCHSGFSTGLLQGLKHSKTCFVLVLLCLIIICVFLVCWPVVDPLPAKSNLLMVLHVIHVYLAL